MNQLACHVALQVNEYILESQHVSRRISYDVLYGLCVICIVLVHDTCHTMMYYVCVNNVLIPTFESCFIITRAGYFLSLRQRVSGAVQKFFSLCTHGSGLNINLLAINKLILHVGAGKHQ